MNFINKMSIGEMIQNISDKTNTDEQLKLMQKYAESNSHLESFFKYAYLNTKIPLIKSIPNYKPNKSPVDLVYGKLHRSLNEIKYFYDGKDAINNETKRNNKLSVILENLNYFEATLFEYLILNTFEKDFYSIKKETVLNAFPHLGENK